jgi:hypothetical protein
MDMGQVIPARLAKGLPLPAVDPVPAWPKAAAHLLCARVLHFCGLLIHAHNEGLIPKPSKKSDGRSSSAAPAFFALALAATFWDTGTCVGKPVEDEAYLVVTTSVYLVRTIAMCNALAALTRRQLACPRATYAQLAPAARPPSFAWLAGPSLPSVSCQCEPAEK